MSNGGGWQGQEERLLSLVVLDDALAGMVSERAGPAFFRAFVVQDRISGKVSVRLRYRYEDGRRNWYTVDPGPAGEAGPGGPGGPGGPAGEAATAAMVERVKAGLKLTLDEVARKMGVELPDGAVRFFDPPDDQGDPGRTFRWLIEQDLIEIVGITGPLS